LDISVKIALRSAATALTAANSCSAKQLFKPARKRSISSAAVAGPHLRVSGLWVPNVGYRRNHPASARHWKDEPSASTRAERRFANCCEHLCNSRDAIGRRKVRGAAEGHHAGPPLPAGRYPGLQLAPLSVLAETREVLTSQLVILASAEPVLFGRFSPNLIAT
jgi:hypothetical protein